MLHNFSLQPTYLANLPHVFPPVFLSLSKVRLLGGGVSSPPLKTELQNLGWWLNPPPKPEKYAQSSNWIILPGIRVKRKSLSNHHLLPGDSIRDLLIPLEVTFSPYQKRSQSQNCQVENFPTQTALSSLHPTSSGKNFRLAATTAGF